jgi:hypothetical protein
MAAEDDVFAELFEEIMTEPEVVATEVADEPEVVASNGESREALIQSLVVEPVVEAAPKPDQVRKEYKTVEKVEIEGSPLATKVYPLGYATLSANGFRFQNKLCVYRKELREFVDFIRDTAKSDPWLASMESAGLRDRGEARKEG